MLDFNRLRIDPGDGYPVMDYRIQNGCVESRVVDVNSDPETGASDGWKRVSPQELSSHVMADTVVARWLRHRLGIFPLVRACYPDYSTGKEPQADPTQKAA